MGHYADALAWARLILEDESPLTGRAASWRAIAAVSDGGGVRGLCCQAPGKATWRGLSRCERRPAACHWSGIEAGLVPSEARSAGSGSPANRLVLDTKWKLLDGCEGHGFGKVRAGKATSTNCTPTVRTTSTAKGDVVLIYPKTDAFDKALPGVRVSEIVRGCGLWVLPFCLCVCPASCWVFVRRMWISRP
jgi:5-methylcytosine-specific restriction enzyme subunit McrC